MIGQFKESGASASGGFYDTPFGSSGFNQYWTVEGNDKNAPSARLDTGISAHAGSSR